MVCAVNTDTTQERTAGVRVDARHNAGAGAFVSRHPRDPAVVGTTTRVEPRNGRAVSVRLPPAGFAVLVPDSP